jgi:hypothetical protein
MIYCPVTRHALRSAPSPLAGERWGGGCLAQRARPWAETPLPSQLRCADLPHKGGGNKERGSALARAISDGAGAKRRR